VNGDTSIFPPQVRLIRMVYGIEASGQKLVTIPKRSDIQIGEYVYIIPVKDVEVKDGKITFNLRLPGQA